MENHNFDIIVIGGGHAGIEASLASARMGLSVALFTMSAKTIGQMSCNPAIGGLAKSHLVREIDALGGEMAKITDKAGIQFKILNKSKGPAVWATRVQCDRALYRKYALEAVASQERLEIIEETVDEVISENGKILGIKTPLGEYLSKAVIITTGTFLNGLIHIGLNQYPAGRVGEPPSLGVSESLSGMGLKLGRLKTGTPPRLAHKGVDLSVMIVQDGDIPLPRISIFTKEITNPQLPCYMTYTNKETHEIILNNLHDSPLYSGVIKGVGPRYCPSIEDKVVRFKERERHQVFLEPEGLDVDEYYANGISTSLSEDAQTKFVHSIAGLENAKITKFGYAIEYDYVYPTQLLPSLETKLIEGLFLAGQINGTSGYEEAAAQGLMAGINAALKIKGKDPMILGRDEAYIGVLIDDLVTKGTKEPYRMFTSRAEYRLLLRQDNADLRLMEKGHDIGLINKESLGLLNHKREATKAEIKRLKHTRVKPQEANPVLISLNSTEIKEDVSLYQLLKRPEVEYSDIEKMSPQKNELSPDIINQVAIQTKYIGYIKRQAELAEKLKKIEMVKIPEDFVFKGIPGLSNEVVGKLEEIKPLNLGQAGRIPGVTPAAISLLMVAVERDKRAMKS
ncbi:MAG: tRNA uridine-5-carboxymethylaminomethyl(34) synthesis enzyme MnmG [Thermodesulfovibrionia bacterium]|nr:tRNA uridine-5-carboxymethylaminomethyl(34) synthesis enzyme MnmG [Thermodesulfovibrionia bacterium]